MLPSGIARRPRCVRRQAFLTSRRRILPLRLSLRRQSFPPHAARCLFFRFAGRRSICLSLHASLSVCLCICLCRGTLGAIKPNDREPMGNAVEPLNVPTSRDENVAASRQAQMTGVLFFRMQPRGGRVASASDCGVRGPRFELHRGRLCLSRQPQRCAALVTGCAPLLQCLGVGVGVEFNAPLDTV